MVNKNLSDKPRTRNYRLKSKLRRRTRGPRVSRKRNMVRKHVSMKGGATGTKLTDNEIAEIEKKIKKILGPEGVEVTTATNIVDKPVPVGTYKSLDLSEDGKTITLKGEGSNEVKWDVTSENYNTILEGLEIAFSKKVKKKEKKKEENIKAKQDEEIKKLIDDINKILGDDIAVFQGKNEANKKQIKEKEIPLGIYTSLELKDDSNEIILKSKKFNKDTENIEVKWTSESNLEVVEILQTINNFLKEEKKSEKWKNFSFSNQNKSDTFKLQTDFTVNGKEQPGFNRALTINPMEKGVRRSKRQISGAFGNIYKIKGNDKLILKVMEKKDDKENRGVEYLQHWPQEFKMGEMMINGKNDFNESDHLTQIKAYGFLISNKDELSDYLTNKQKFLTKESAFDFSKSNDFCVLPISTFVLMEKAESDLNTLLEKNQTLDLETILSLYYQIILGLKTLHDKEIYHYDLKPQNILVFKDKNVITLKLSDYGTCVFNDQVLCIKQDEKYVGTTLYSHHELQGNKRDIWSMYVILLEMIYRTSPLQKDKKFEVFEPNYDQTMTIEELYEKAILTVKDINEKVSFMLNSQSDALKDKTFDLISNLSYINTNKKIYKSAKIFEEYFRDELFNNDLFIGVNLKYNFDIRLKKKFSIEGKKEKKKPQLKINKPTLKFKQITKELGAEISRLLKNDNLTEDQNKFIEYLEKVSEINKMIFKNIEYKQTTPETEKVTIKFTYEYTTDKKKYVTAIEKKVKPTVEFNLTQDIYDKIIKITKEEVSGFPEKLKEGLKKIELLYDAWGQLDKMEIGSIEYNQDQLKEITNKLIELNLAKTNEQGEAEEKLAEAEKALAEAEAKANAPSENDAAVSKAKDAVISANFEVSKKEVEALSLNPDKQKELFNQYFFKKSIDKSAQNQKKTSVSKAQRIKIVSVGNIVDGDDGVDGKKNLKVEIKFISPDKTTSNGGGLLQILSGGATETEGNGTVKGTLEDNGTPEPTPKINQFTLKFKGDETTLNDLKANLENIMKISEELEKISNKQSEPENSKKKLIEGKPIKVKIDDTRYGLILHNHKNKDYILKEMVNKLNDKLTLGIVVTDVKMKRKQFEFSFKATTDLDKDKFIKYFEEKYKLYIDNYPIKNLSDETKDALEKKKNEFTKKKDAIYKFLTEKSGNKNNIDNFDLMMGIFFNMYSEYKNIKGATNPLNTEEVIKPSSGNIFVKKQITLNTTDIDKTRAGFKKKLERATQDKTIDLSKFQEDFFNKLREKLKQDKHLIEYYLKDGEKLGNKLEGIIYQGKETEGNTLSIVYEYIDIEEEYSVDLDRRSIIIDTILEFLEKDFDPKKLKERQQQPLDQIRIRFMEDKMGDKEGKDDAEGRKKPISKLRREQTDFTTTDEGIYEPEVVFKNFKSKLAKAFLDKKKIIKPEDTFDFDYKIDKLLAIIHALRKDTLSLKPSESSEEKDKKLKLDFSGDSVEQSGGSSKHDIPITIYSYSLDGSKIPEKIKHRITYRIQILDQNDKKLSMYIVDKIKEALNSNKKFTRSDLPEMLQNKYPEGITFLKFDTFKTIENIRDAFTSEKLEKQGLKLKDSYLSDYDILRQVADTRTSVEKEKQQVYWRMGFKFLEAKGKGLVPDTKSDLTVIEYEKKQPESKFQDIYNVFQKELYKDFKKRNNISDDDDDGSENNFTIVNETLFEALLKMSFVQLGGAKIEATQKGYRDLFSKGWKSRHKIEIKIRGKTKDDKRLSSTYHIYIPKNYNSDQIKAIQDKINSMSSKFEGPDAYQPSQSVKGKFINTRESVLKHDKEVSRVKSQGLSTLNKKELDTGSSLIVRESSSSSGTGTGTGTGIGCDKIVSHCKIETVLDADKGGREYYKDAKCEWAKYDERHALGWDAPKQENALSKDESLLQTAISKKFAEGETFGFNKGDSIIEIDPTGNLDPNGNTVSEDVNIDFDDTNFIVTLTLEVTEREDPTVKITIPKDTTVAHFKEIFPEINPEGAKFNTLGDIGLTLSRFKGKTVKVTNIEDINGLFGLLAGTINGNANYKFKSNPEINAETETKEDGLKLKIGVKITLEPEPAESVPETPAAQTLTLETDEVDKLKTLSESLKLVEETKGGGYRRNKRTRRGKHRRIRSRNNMIKNKDKNKSKIIKKKRKKNRKKKSQRRKRLAVNLI